MIFTYLLINYFNEQLVRFTILYRVRVTLFLVKEFVWGLPEIGLVVVLRHETFYHYVSGDGRNKVFRTISLMWTCPARYSIIIGRAHFVL